MALDPLSTQSECQFIDAHCHLADPRFDPIRDQVIDRALMSGIGGFIQGGVSPTDWDRQLELAGQYKGHIYPVFGLHPWWVAAEREETCEQGLDQLARRLNQAVGLGELGLDHSPRFSGDTYARQEHYFRAQLQLANQSNRPVVLHIVHAHALGLEILKEVGVPPNGGIVHSFSEGIEIAQSYLKLGLTLSLGGSVARKGFGKIKRAVLELPLDRVVIESDAPDQSPPGYRDRLNEPASIHEVARALATLKGVGVGEILSQSALNLRKIFELEF